MPAYIRPLFCEDKVLRWVALSGDRMTLNRPVIAELFPEDKALHRWLKMAERSARATVDLLAWVRRARARGARIQ